MRSKSKKFAELKINEYDVAFEKEHRDKLLIEYTKVDVAKVRNEFDYWTLVCKRRLQDEM